MPQQEPEETQNSEMAPEVAESADLENLKQALSEERERAAGYLTNWQRAQADFVNYKRRIEQEREEFNKFANSSLMLSLLPILDDLERALDHVSQKRAPQWAEGVKLIERKLRATLEAQGLAPIKALGEQFDPKLHEAVRQDKGEQGIVIEEMQKGYTLHGRLLRPAMVVVGNGEEQEAEQQKEDK